MLYSRATAPSLLPSTSSALLAPLSRWRGQSIARKLGLAFGLLLLALAGLGLFSVQRQQRLDASAQQLSAVHLPGVAASLRLAELATRRHSLDYLMAMSEREQVAALGQRIDALDAELQQLLAGHEKQLRSEAERQLFTDATQALRHYSTLRQGVQALVQAGGQAAAMDLITNEGARRFEDARGLLLQLTEVHQQAARQEAQQAETLYLQSRRQTLALVLGLLVAAGTLAWGVTRSITGPLRDVVALASAVAQGDLSRDPELGRHRPDSEIGRMNSALAAMSARLRDMVEALRLGIDSLSSTSVQLASGNQDLSARTEDSGLRLQATARSMAAMTASLRQTLHTAESATRLSSEAAEVADQGGRVVHQMVSDMQDIRSAAQEIRDISSVIDGIAFKTNLLALNAAIEAARAGEQGRGFAVVAAEVRQLAQSSSQAARQIGQLVKASVQRTELGSERAQQAGQQIAGLVREVAKVRDLMGRVKQDAAEQGQHVDAVERSMQALEQMTLQNAALVQQSAAASAALQAQAGDLSLNMRRFRTAA